MKITDTYYYQKKQLNLHSRKLGREIMRSLKPVFIPIIEWLNPICENYMKMKALRIIITLLIINVSMSSMVYSFKHQRLTQTEVFLHIPKSFLWSLK